VLCVKASSALDLGGLTEKVVIILGLGCAVAGKVTKILGNIKQAWLFRSRAA
jgi:hypothetical protein